MNNCLLPIYILLLYIIIIISFQNLPLVFYSIGLFVSQHRHQNNRICCFFCRLFFRWSKNNKKILLLLAVFWLIFTFQKITIKWFRSKYGIFLWIIKTKIFDKRNFLHFCFMFYRIFEIVNFFSLMLLLTGFTCCEILKV